MREKAGIQTLHKRRETFTLKFAQKASKSERFAHWFPLRNKTAATRNNRPYLEKTSRTDRNKNSPTNYMRRVLNNSLAARLCLKLGGKPNIWKCEDNLICNIKKEDNYTH